MPRRTLIIILLALLMPVAALAHGVLKSSVPAKDARLSAVPRELRLTFTEPVELAVTAVELRAAPESAQVQGSPVALSALRHAGDSAQVVIADIQSPMTEGTYTVAWRVTGRDGHPVRGTFSFVIAPGAAGVAKAGSGNPPATHDHMAGTGTARADSGTALPAPVMQAEDEGFGTGSPLYVIVRALTFAGLLGVLGAVVFRTLVLARATRGGAAVEFTERVAQRTLTVGIMMAALLLVVGMLRLYAQSYATHGAQGVLDVSLVGTMLTKTIWGSGWLLQMVATAVVLIGFLTGRRRAGGKSGGMIAVVGALALAVSPALSGHAVASPEFAWVAVPNDALHVIGAGGWMGSLFVLIAVGIPAALGLSHDRGKAVSTLVNAFSPLALTFATLAAGTGVVSAWLHLGSFAALWSSDYGRTLTIKILVLLPVIALGAYNWLRVRPGLGDDAGGQRIRRTAATELAIGVLVLAVTAVLVATPPPVQ